MLVIEIQARFYITDVIRLVLISFVTQPVEPLLEHH